MSTISSEVCKTFALLRELCEVIPGRHILEDSHNRNQRGVPYLTGPSDFGSQQATASRWTEKPDVMCAPNDVLVTVKGAGVAKVNFAPSEPACIGRQLMAIRARPNKTNASFIFFALLWAQEQLKSQATGATVPGLSITDLEKLRLPNPPRDRHEPIAAKLREQLTAVEQARVAIDSQLQSTNALPSAFLRAVFASPATHWKPSRLGDVLRLRKDVVHPRDQPKGAATFVGLEHVESQTGRRIGSLAVEMSNLTGRKPRFYEGDIVYGYLRPYLNKVWLADFDGLCSVDQYVFAVNADKADATFVAWFMRSAIYLDRAPIDATPGQLPRIRTEEVAKVEVELPPLAEQRAIAARINSELKQAQTLQDALTNKLDAVEKMSATLLREAFSRKN